MGVYSGSLQWESTFGVYGNLQWESTMGINNGNLQWEWESPMGVYNGNLQRESTWAVWTTDFGSENALPRLTRNMQVAALVV